MISFRNHLLSLVAVFIALAIGIVLGGGPLSEVGEQTTRATSAASGPETRAAEVGEEFARSAAPVLYGDTLADRPVAVLTFPGTDPDLVEELAGQVEAAGATVATRQALGAGLVSTGEKALVDTLGSQLVEQLPDGVVTEEATTYERIGELLGRAVASQEPEGAERDAPATTILEGMSGADLLADVAEADVRAPLLLVVLGDEVSGEGGDDIVAGLVRGLDRSSVGTVVVGSSDSGEGQLGRLRDADGLGEASSVDGVELAPGQVAAVLALGRSLTGSGGSFGASGDDGVVPLG